MIFDQCASEISSTPTTMSAVPAVCTKVTARM
jgi:hypothetical protein